VRWRARQTVRPPSWIAGHSIPLIGQAPGEGSVALKSRLDTAMTCPSSGEQPGACDAGQSASYSASATKRKHCQDDPGER